MDTQKKVEQLWSNGKGYDVYIKDELESFRVRAWTNLIQSHLPKNTSLKVLDIGTGPGFFSCILSKAGHHVTGIDCSASMIECAKENAEKAGVYPDFYVMDSHNLAFEDDTFDLIVNRNVTWTLHNPTQAYKQWMRVLKPGGRILIFDANWHMQFFDENVAKQVEKNEREYFETYDKEFKICSEDDFIKNELPLSNTWRPQWDIQALTKLGFEHVDSVKDIGDFVYADWEKKLYSALPLFKITAIKPGTVSPCHLAQHRIDHKTQLEQKLKAQTWSELVCSQFPANRKLKVLNVKSGTGYLATSLAELGHEVFSVDTCQQNIEHTKTFAQQKGGNAEFICMQRNQLSFDEEVFDIVIHGDELVNEQSTTDGMLRQWRRLLKPDGFLLCFHSKEVKEFTVKEAANNNLNILGFDVVDCQDISKLEWEQGDDSYFAVRPELLIIAKKHTGNFYPY